MAVKIKTKRGDGAALIASLIAHIVVIAILVSQAAPQYILPEPPAPPMDVQIVTAPEIPPPPIVPPKMTPRKIVPETTTPPTPAPPLPVPKPTPAPPAPPKSLPTKPEPPKAAPVVTTPAPPRPVTVQTPPQPPRPTLPKPAPPSPPTTIPAPAKLNIHKPKEDAPASVATLPMAPSPTPAQAAAGGPATAAQTPGSRLSGLTPFPLGSMPSGGTGLRGSLVGCANADSVRLSSVERAHCSERFGVEITRAPKLDGIPPAKRAAFDRAAAAQDRSLHAGAIDPMEAMEAKHGRASDYGGGVVTGPASTYVKPGPN